MRASGTFARGDDEYFTVPTKYTPYSRYAVLLLLYTFLYSILSSIMSFRRVCEKAIMSCAHTNTHNTLVVYTHRVWSPSRRRQYVILLYIFIYRILCCIFVTGYIMYTCMYSAHATVKRTTPFRGHVGAAGGGVYRLAKSIGLRPPRRGDYSCSLDAAAVAIFYTAKHRTHRHADDDGPTLFPFYTYTYIKTYIDILYLQIRVGIYV